MPLFEVVVSCAVVCDVVVLVDVVSELDMEVSVLVSEVSPVSLPEVDEVDSAVDSVCAVVSVAVLLLIGSGSVVDVVVDTTSSPRFPSVGSSA